MLLMYRTYTYTYSMSINSNTVLCRIQKMTDSGSHLHDDRMTRTMAAQGAISLAIHRKCHSLQ